MEKGKTVKIEISDKFIYIFLILAIIFLGIVTVQAVVSHSSIQITGACESDGTGCTFQNNYYTASEFSAIYDTYVAPD